MQKHTAIHSIRLVPLLLISLLFPGGCKDDAMPQGDAKNSQLQDINHAATAIYTLYIQGRFDEYVKQVESNDTKPENYCKQMAILHKVRFRQQQEENGGPLKCRTIKVEPHGDNYANVILEVTYRNQTKENIIQQMVKVDGEWRIR